MQEQAEDTDVDGFSFAHAVMPESFNNALDLLAPELAKRGVCKEAVPPRQIAREKLGSQGAKLATPHPAARHRNLRQQPAVPAE
jgi:hypothetical protein